MCWSRLGDDAAKLAVGEGKLAVKEGEFDPGKVADDEGKLDANAGKRAGASSSRLPNFFIARTASSNAPSAGCRHP